MVGESQEAVGAGVGGGSSGSNKMPTLEEYGTNLTTQAEEVGSVLPLSPTLLSASTVRFLHWMRASRSKSNIMLSSGNPGSSGSLAQ